jgi:alanyl-tRNA synthetase
MEKEREISQGEDAGFASVSAGGDGGFERLPPTRFLGYEHTSAEAEVLAAVQARDAWQVVLSESPFYGESGGQVGDTGSIQCGELRFRVEDTQKEGGRLIHLGTIEAGDPLKLRQGAVVRAQVDEDRRRRVERNHSATHLLHAALRRVLGGHVQQKGSLVEPGRLRFDVSHFSAVSPEELERAQALVRAEVRANIAVETLEMGREEALARGALAFFEEKYGDRVRVVRMGDFSMELCGGTHVKRTGDVGAFAVVHEGSVSSGVRRVEAWTAEEAEKLATENSRLVASLARSLRVTPEKLIERIERLLEENRELKAGRGKAAAAGGGAGSIGGQLEREQLGEVLLVRGLYEGLDGKALLAAYDGFKKEAKKLAVVVVSKLDGGKVQVLVALSPALVKDGLSAKTVFARGAELLGARGGGRDEMVQGSGSAGERAEEAVRAMAEAVRRGVGRG